MKSTTYTLKIFDRLNIPSLLPETAKYETGIVCRDIREKITLTQEELTEFDFKSFPQNEGRVSFQWDQTKDTGKDFQFTELEEQLIRHNLEKMNKEEKLPTDPRWLALYAMFTNGEK